MFASILGFLGISIMVYFAFFFWVSRKKYKIHLEVDDLIYEKDTTNIKNEAHERALRKYNKSDLNESDPNLLLTCFADFLVLIIIPVVFFILQIVLDAYDPVVAGSFLFLGIVILAIKNNSQIRGLNNVLDILHIYPNRSTTDSKNSSSGLSQSNNYNIENNKELIEIIILAEVNNKLEVLRKIKELVNLDIDESKKIIDNAPSKLYSTYSKSEANNIKYELEKLGVEIALVNK
jgi:large subunit ribosomal protein L7/L12